MGNPINHGSQFDQNIISDTVYNKAGQVIATRDARGTETAFAYDNAGRRQQVVQAAGTNLATAAYTCYDKAGRVLRTISHWSQAGHPDAQDVVSGAWLFVPATHGTQHDQNRIVEHEYDGAGRRVKTIDPVGNETLTTYRLDGQVASITDPTGMTTVFRYDQLRRRTLTVQNHVDNGDDPAEWVWNGSNWETSDTTPIAHGTENDQNVIVQVGYDTLGRRTSQRDPRGNLTQYDYDQLGRRIKLTDPLDQAWETVYEDVNTSGAAYTGQTRTKLIDPLNVTTQRQFDRGGRLISIGYGAPADTFDVMFAYDLAGNRIRMTENDGTNDRRITGFGYDRARRLDTVQFDADADETWDEEISYTYDLGGRKTSLTLPSGLTVSYAYDEKGRLTHLTDWHERVTQFSYDAANRQTAARRSNGLHTYASYDVAGRLRALHHHDHLRALAQFEYNVDGRGNRVQAYERLANLPVMLDTYDKDDANVSYVRGNWTDSGDFKLTASTSGVLQVSFDADEIALTYGTGDDHGIFDVYVNGSLWRSLDSYATENGEQTVVIRLKSESVNSLEIRNRRAKNLASSGYTLRFKQVDLLVTTCTERTIAYTYDALSRLLVTGYYEGAEPVGTPTLTYDYAYDLMGNRTQQVIDDGVDVTTTNHTYNALNQIADAGFTYDANGNLTGDGTHTYTWNRANRLTGMGGISYAYDGLGSRISQTIGGIVTSYLLDYQPGLVKVLASDTEGQIDRFVFDNQGRVHAWQNAGGAWASMATDGLGSVRLMADEDLTVTAIDSFSPVGVPFDTEGVGSPFSFTGEPLDDNGLLYLRARYYHPGLGVFTGLDPIENLNRYQYVDSNPVNLVDPSGKDVKCFDWTCNQIETELLKALLGWMSSDGWVRGISERVRDMLLDKCCLYDLFLIDRGMTPAEPCNPDPSCFDADGDFTSTTWEGHQLQLTELRERLDEILKCYQWRNNNVGRHDGTCPRNPSLLGLAAQAKQQTNDIPNIEPKRYGYEVAPNIMGSQSVAPVPQATIDTSINWTGILDRLADEDIQAMSPWTVAGVVATLGCLYTIAAGGSIFDREYR